MQESKGFLLIHAWIIDPVTDDMLYCRFCGNVETVVPFGEGCKQTTDYYYKKGNFAKGVVIQNPQSFTQEHLS